MEHLTAAEGLVLNAFHEHAGDRAGVPPDYEIDAEYLGGVKERAPGLDVDRAVARLEERRLIDRTGDGGYRITEAGVAALYPEHSGQGGVHSAG